MWFVLNVKCFTTVKCVLCTQWKWDSLPTTRMEGKKHGRDWFSRRKMNLRKSNVTLLLFSVGHFERIYLGSSGRTQL